MNDSTVANSLRVLGIDISRANPESALAQVLASRHSNTTLKVNFLNSYCVVLANELTDYRNLLNTSAFNFCDGKPLAFIARALTGEKEIRQVRGPSFFEHCLTPGNAVGESHYFIGGTELTRSKMLHRLRKDNPEIEISGFECPPFRDLSAKEREERISRIIESGATLVWMGLGTPKQDFEGYEIASKTHTVVFSVGAAFDFYSHTKSEAPKWIQKIGLEWFFRLATEPRRLWKRYLIGNLKFVALAVKYAFKGLPK